MDEHMDFFNYQKDAQPEKGDLLISEPFLPDVNFERSVVYICEHNEEGTIGFILNKPSLLRFDEVIEDVEDFNVPTYVGGPVQQNTLHFLHRDPEKIPGALEVTQGIYWGGDYDLLFNQIENRILDQNNYKFFLGYSGWSPGQLEGELKERSWIIYKTAEPSKIFDVEDKYLWKTVLEDMGGKYKMFANYPTDPRLN